MTSIHQESITLDAFLALPERKPALEYADGEVTQKVSPKGEHSALQEGFLRVVNEFGVPRRLARAFPEVRTTFAGASPVPDVSVYAWARIPRNADRIATDFLTPPDIAVEIRSPGQTRRSQIDRCRWYVANGVQISLMLDHHDETVRRFVPGAQTLLAGDDWIDLELVLPGLRLSVRQLFAALRLD